MNQGKPTKKENIQNTKKFQLDDYFGLESIFSPEDNKNIVLYL